MTPNTQQNSRELAHKDAFKLLDGTSIGQDSITGSQLKSRFIEIVFPRYTELQSLLERVEKVEKERDGWKMDYEACKIRSNEWQSKFKTASAERDQLAKDKARLVEGFKKLHSEVLATDFNEHWESYTESAALLKEMERL